MTQSPIDASAGGIVDATRASSVAPSAAPGGIPEDILAGRRVVLGVTGSIAAYKALTVASRLNQAGAMVDTILTESAARLVTPLAFQALTHRPVVGDLWDPASPLAMDHIALAHAADVLLVAPATAHAIARLALGLADDALTTTALATRAPLVIAPAMEPDMWSHPATQGHVATLIARGATFIGPRGGRMASGKLGRGRLEEPEAIVDHVRAILGRSGPLEGRRVLVTAGPTREAIDPVRYIGNHSTGRMGYAIARAARDAGAAVVLVTGPVDLAPPVAVEVVRVETAAQMREAVIGRAAAADAIIMTAAVADYRPVEASTRKIKKTDAEVVLHLTRNPDILADLDAHLAALAAADSSRSRPVRVGFAAETHDLVGNARDKLARKGLDLIVANPVPETFGSDRSAATFVTAGGATALGERSKAGVAGAIVRWVGERVASG